MIGRIVFIPVNRRIGPVLGSPARLLTPSQRTPRSLGLSGRGRRVHAFGLAAARRDRVQHFRRSPRAPDRSSVSDRSVCGTGGPSSLTLPRHEHVDQIVRLRASRAELTPVSLPRRMHLAGVGWIASCVPRRDSIRPDGARFGQAGSAFIPFITGVLAETLGVRVLQPIMLGLLGAMRCVLGQPGTSLIFVACFGSSYLA